MLPSVGWASYHKIMVDPHFEHRRQLERLTANQLTAYQLERLNRLLTAIQPHNRFYSEKLGMLQLPLQNLDGFFDFPFTYKEELNPTSNSGSYASNLTFPPENYIRFHRTSGTRGRPLIVMDTAKDWQWWVDTWQYVLDVAELGAEDRALLGFSFGPFIGFWSAFDAAVARGCLVIPAGGMNSIARLELMSSSRATVLFCTPSYALHLAEIAQQNQIDTTALPVRRIIVAGEPGGSLPAIRNRMEQAWHAKVTDHAGASEVGPWGYADRDGRGLHVNEAEFIAEFLSVETGKPAAEGELSELVLTTLGRTGCPVIRYRTGDLVRPTWSTNGDCRFVLLEGGVLGRVDDMMIIRGVNIYPSAIEQILHSFPEVVEYRMTAHKTGEMDFLTIEVEDRLNAADRIAKELQLRLGLKIAVHCVPGGSLPRFEGKGNRFVDQR